VRQERTCNHTSTEKVTCATICGTYNYLSWEWVCISVTCVKMCKLAKCRVLQLKFLMALVLVRSSSSNSSTSGSSSSSSSNMPVI
jgi:hypothetical protein